MLLTNDELNHGWNTDETQKRQALARPFHRRISSGDFHGRRDGKCPRCGYLSPAGCGGLLAGGVRGARAKSLVLKKMWRYRSLESLF